jgi:secreted PhoX family phosphatase
MTTSRRAFIKSGSLFLAATAWLGDALSSASPASASSRRCRRREPGYGDLVPDPEGIIDLPRGFRYRVLSQAGDELSAGGLVPSRHDGMAAFSAGGRGTLLVRNHELEPADISEDGLIPVPPLPDSTYDPEGVGGTTTLLVGRRRELIHHGVSLAGTVNNCAGGPTPWRTWLSCEETTMVLEKPHGYVFEVDPRRGGNPEPIVGMGRFAHEAVSFDRRGRAYLTEDASKPFGCIYRFTPQAPLRGCGSLHAGGRLEALAVTGVDSDLSIVSEPGTRLPVRWLEVPNPNPLRGATSVRKQSIGLGATPVKKAEGTWCGRDGEIWFVSSYAGGPDARGSDVTAAAHGGQIWRYEPSSKMIELAAVLPPDSDHDGPDNITAGPHGFALACTDGKSDQWLIGIDEDGQIFPFAFNAGNDEELAGVTFSPDGRTLYVNVQGTPAVTLAIWGPWHREGRMATI